ncbi:MAG: PspC domain-containing protein, partial [Gemmatimonadetes bacterium]|nr:PspC domain-containing protein [Gemmatimonadota bacterium]NIQ52315.1 PspC domain-containing protein [Gemmatimonadota bacterium]NIU72418.1 PspC domain-containing protein [Gammaproteobacteria bacterium]NIX42883.1 PspC domain-containing protein [Gemmatimonadota bacterium]NIY07063.1 PspC domain-containing protein [Gemmatimonadota bacterium]
RARLARSRTDRMVAGVCGGIAEYFGWDSTLVRVVYVAVSVLSAAFPGLIVYAVLWILMPPGSRARGLDVEGDAPG